MMKCLQKVIRKFRALRMLVRANSATQEELEMKELMLDEIAMVSGGADKGGKQKCFKREHDVVPCPQSDAGNIANDISNGAFVVGSAIADFIYSLFKQFFRVVHCPRNGMARAFGEESYGTLEACCDHVLLPGDARVVHYRNDTLP